MKAEYKNWMPAGMVAGFGAAAAGLAVGAAGLGIKGTGKVAAAGAAICGAGAIGLGIMTAWCKYAYDRFSYNGTRQLSRHIVEGVAGYVNVPEGGSVLDIGCGSGALAIAVAKRNPSAKVTGCDRWGIEYASYSKELCQKNAAAEGTGNVSFTEGDACHLPFGDESFDAICSNYVYHNVMGADKEDLLMESFRCLRKGGTFAIHDSMDRFHYGKDIFEIAQHLRDQGFEKVELIDTCDGMFMTRLESKLTFLSGSMLLTGIK